MNDKINLHDMHAQSAEYFDKTFGFPLIFGSTSRLKTPSESTDTPCSCFTSCGCWEIENYVFDALSSFGLSEPLVQANYKVTVRAARVSDMNSMIESILHTPDEYKNIQMNLLSVDCGENEDCCQIHEYVFHFECFM